MKTERKSGSKKRSILVALIIGAISILGWFIGKMPREERHRLFSKYEERTRSAREKLVSFFIPHESNDYKPKVFQKHAVRNILFMVVAIKVAVVSTLFIAYPNEARLIADVRGAMYGFINEYRVDSGSQTLAPNQYLESAAAAKASDMLSQNYFSHYGPDGTKPWEWIDSSIYNYSSMGENLAMDFLTANSVFKAFQKSPTHDKNLINPKYSDIGIAVTNGFLDGKNTNLMVVFFASPKADSETQLAQAAVEPAQEQPVDVQPVVNESVQTEPVVEEPEQVESEPAEEGISQEPIAEPVIPVETTEVDEPESQIADARDVVPELQIERISDPIEPQTEVLGEALIAQEDVVTENLSAGVVFSEGSALQRFISWADRFLLAFLIAAIVLLIINIVVKIRVQHAPVIANAILLIIVVSAALYVNVHTVEAIGDKIRILSAFIT